jgi:hypothetical protein
VNSEERRWKTNGLPAICASAVEFAFSTSWPWIAAAISCSRIRAAGERRRWLRAAQLLEVDRLAVHWLPVDWLAVERIGQPRSLSLLTGLFAKVRLLSDSPLELRHRG